MKILFTVLAAGALSLSSLQVHADGSYLFDPNAKRFELFNDVLVLDYGGITESTHPSGCKCLKAEYNQSGWPNVSDRSTLQSWYGTLLLAQHNQKRVLIYRDDDWKILSLSNPSSQ